MSLFSLNRRTDESMTAKNQFLKRLQARHSPPTFSSKHQADIAAFRQQMALLLDNMNAWLTDTALQAEELTVSVTDLLVEEGAFAIPGIVLSYENRTIKFIPLFLYGQGVIGCVEVTLCTGNNVTRLSRLFMRAGQVSAWTLNQQRDLSRPGELFDEDAFFHLINVLLP